MILIVYEYLLLQAASISLDALPADLLKGILGLISNLFIIYNSISLFTNKYNYQFLLMGILMINLSLLPGNTYKNINICWSIV